MARRTIAGAAIIGIAALATGCGAAGIPTSVAAAPAPTASPTTTTTAPTGTSTPSAPSGTSLRVHPPAPTSATSSRVPTHPAACPTRSLQVKAGASQGTAGSVYTVLDFTNISRSACTLYGYPGVSFAGGTPVSQIGLAAAESTATGKTLVTLAPGATANALLQIVDAGNYPSSTCHPVTAQYLQIYPPNQTTPIYLSYTSLTCSAPVQILTVGVIQPGAGSA